MTGFGFWISGQSMEDYHYSKSESTIQESEKQFREALIEQIHELTGVKPRIKWEQDEKSYIIYYS